MVNAPSPPPWDRIFTLLLSQLEKEELPSVSRIAQEKRDPFRILISTMISLRTKDEVTMQASSRLFSRSLSPKEIFAMSEKDIAEIIYPAGFYRTKAKNIKRTSGILLEKYSGEVPRKMEDLLSLPGVGRKTANLVLNLGYGIPAICVDTHVHRICNRTGWVRTSTPEETEFALMDILPENLWIDINEILVTFGQSICTPQSPWCSKCSIPSYCEKENVPRSR